MRAFTPLHSPGHHRHHHRNNHIVLIIVVTMIIRSSCLHANDAFAQEGNLDAAPTPATDGQHTKVHLYNDFDIIVWIVLILDNV